MSFAINTNVASLQAQEYLRTNSDFQAKTINRVTSGLRIISSGDDAAGLAIANTFRSDQSVLSQGVRNANDGLSQLQIADGGISNISKLLDRARTLATQSASGGFTGGSDGRKLLDGEFQSVIGEIDRQAKAIGLDSGGAFNTNLAIFIGGGRGADAQGVIDNGTVAVDLSTSAVDSKSLGLQGFAFQGAAIPAAQYQQAAGATDGNASKITFNGPGYTNVDVVVDLSTAGDIHNVNDLAAALNVGIQAKTTGGTDTANAFKAANIVAKANLDGSISFTSSKAFEVSALVSAGHDDGSQILSGTGAVSWNYAQGTNRNTTTALAYTALSTTGTQTQTITLSSVGTDGLNKSIDVNLDSTTTTKQTTVDAINTALQGSNEASLQGIVAVVDGAGTIGFTSSKAFNLTIAASSDANTTGFTGIAVTGATLSGGLVAADTVTASASINTIDSAKAAVTSLANAVTALGQAQANVGKGQNQFSYAINLASSQLTNLAAAESRIRDADLASEAANLTKAQTLLQAGIAALAQANSAPQGVLSLLRG